MAEGLLSPGSARSECTTSAAAMVDDPLPPSGMPAPPGLMAAAQLQSQDEFGSDASPMGGIQAQRGRGGGSDSEVDSPSQQPETALAGERGSYAQATQRAPSSGGEAACPVPTEPQADDGCAGDSSGFDGVEADVPTADGAAATAQAPADTADPPQALQRVAWALSDGTDSGSDRDDGEWRHCSDHFMALSSALDADEGDWEVV